MGKRKIGSRGNKGRGSEGNFGEEEVLGMMGGELEEAIGNEGRRSMGSSGEENRRS